MEMCEILARLRNEKGFTQTEVARAINVVPSAVSKYENGNNYPEYDTLLKLADFYGVSLDILFSRTTIRTPVARLEGKLKTRRGMVPVDALFKLNEADKELVGLLFASLMQKEEYRGR